MKQLQRNLIYFVLLVIKKQTKINKHQPRKAQIAVGSSQKTLHPSLKCENISHTSGRGKKKTGFIVDEIYKRRISEEKISGMSGVISETAR